MMSAVKEERNTQALPLTWTYLSWVGLLPAVIVIGIIGVIAQGDPEPFIENILGFGDIAIFSLGLYGLGLCLAVFLLRRHLKTHIIGWDRVGLIGQITPFALIYILGALALDSFLLFPGAQWLSTQTGIPLFWGGNNTFNFASVLDIAVALIATVLIASVAEEIIFRGYLLTAFLEKGYKKVTAITFSVLIFASVHIFFGPGFILYIIVWALIPTYLYLKFKSLYPAILFHALNNVVAYLILPLL
jgi:membrane protease YdiL (CAAX protease family)